MQRIFITGLVCSTAFFTGAQAAETETQNAALHDVIIVTEQQNRETMQRSISPDGAPLMGMDATLLAARTPGAARIGNGALSGQMQYRGLFGERLNLRVDGQAFASGGPNLMDPVFHYAPAPLVDAVVIDRGVSPVSAGPGLAGGANARFKRLAYGADDTPRFGYDVSVSGRSANDATAGGGIAGMATQKWRVNVLGALEEGNDTKFDAGTVAGSGFQRGVFGVSAAHRLAAGELRLDARRQNTEPSGTPPFPMDIQYFDTDFARFGYSRQIGAWMVDAHLFNTDVAHLMDNHSLRPDPVSSKFRASYADARTEGGDVTASLSALGGDLSFGVDQVEMTHHVTITNPNNAAFKVTPFPHIELQRLGGFAQWQGPFSGRLANWQGQLGARFDRHDYQAGQATAEGVMAGPVNLANGFNAADRQGDAQTLDLVARFWTVPINGLSWRASLARKEKMPGYIQRFGWLPITASGGLADGNIYVGDLTLDKETALIAEFGVDMTTPRSYLRPTVYVRQIDDYIQGTAVAASETLIINVATMNGDTSLLKWGNVDARLTGFDLDMGYDVAGPFRLDAVVNYVRGKRRDSADNLYRIAPPNATVSLTWEAPLWSAGIEARLVAEQDKISTSNEELRTDAYQLVNLYADRELRDNLRLHVGVENLFDTDYRDHLSGINRNGFGDVAVGARVPGAGRGVFVRFSVVR